jgi:hypothetical protein
VSNITLYDEGRAIDNQRVCDLVGSSKRDFVYGAIRRLAAQCGGLGYFWKAEDMEFILEGWVDGLGPFKTKRIVAVIDLILDCKYKKIDSFGREDYVPRTVIDFKNFMIHTQSTFEIEPKKYVDSPPPSEEDRKRYAEFLTKIKRSFRFNKSEIPIVDKE